MSVKYLFGREIAKAMKIKSKPRRAEVKSRQQVEAKNGQLTRKERLDQLQGAVALCFVMLGERTDRELSLMTRLSRSTVRNLRVGNYTLNVRFGTIQSLVLVAGFVVEIANTGVYVSLLD